MGRPDPAPILNPHLDRWRNLGLVDAWEMDFTPARLWRIRWWNGRVTEWREEALRAAILAMDAFERKLADA